VGTDEVICCGLFLPERPPLGNTQEESSGGGDDDDDFGGSRYVQWLKEGVCHVKIWNSWYVCFGPARALLGGLASLTRPQYHMTDNTARARGEREEEEEEGMYQPPPLPPQFKKNARER
jgi:hypothetical protein